MTLQSLDGVHTTRWSLIRELDAGNTDSRSQFNALCLRYWSPVHQYIRDNGHAEAQARHLTQQFFALLGVEGLSRAAGFTRFRDFLAHELAGFLASHQAGHGQPQPPLSPASATSTPGTPIPRPAPEPGSASLERSLALEVVAQCMARLRKEAADAGHMAMFERLQHYLSVEPRRDELLREAETLGATQLFVSMAIRRLRQRFRTIVDDELTQLITDPAQLAEERAAMFSALAHPG